MTLLLDHNLPHQLRDLMAAYGLETETAASRGWERLRNGDLVTAAHAAGLKPSSRAISGLQSPHHNR